MCFSDFVSVLSTVLYSRIAQSLVKPNLKMFCAQISAVRYTAMLEDGTVFEKKGFDEGPLEFITDEGNSVIKLLNMPIICGEKHLYLVVTKGI